jgi:hypothetical protein
MKPWEREWTADQRRAFYELLTSLARWVRAEVWFAKWADFEAAERLLKEIESEQGK